MPDTPQITTLADLERAIDVYAVPGERSIVDWIDPTTGLTWINKHTIEQVQARYPAAIRMTWADWQATISAQQRTPITWQETTRAEYWRMLEVLPPALRIGGAFLVGEPHDHDVENGRPRFAAYWQRGPEGGARYYRASRPLTGRELREQIGRTPSDQIDYRS